ncbi:hypothetical protein AMR72_02065 [Flavobacterium psychrophilum]|nr:hypothetical protein AMR72_02065 [Flavobacterium psychrophilum]AOE51414.1 hypothetical protein ALW18_02065 [Flavobacterium psychrophilum]
MNKFFKTAALAAILLSANSIIAQDSKTGTTTLNVNLGSVLAIEVANPSVTIQMTTAAHLRDGNSSSELSDHVKVTATEGYTVTVQASTDLTNGGVEIPVSTVKIKTEKGSYLGASGSTAPTTTPTFPTTEPALSATAPVQIIESSTGDFRGFNVTYTIPAEETPAYLDKATGVYTTTLTYTIAAD